MTPTRKRLSRSFVVPAPLTATTINDPRKSSRTSRVPALRERVPNDPHIPALSYHAPPGKRTPAQIGPNTF